MSGDSQLLTSILEKVNEVSERTARTETKIIGIEDRLTKIESHDLTQNNLLDTHIQGTKDNRERLELEIKNRKEMDNRLKEVEKKVNAIPNFFKTVKKIALYIGAIAAAIYEVGRVMHWWS